MDCYFGATRIPQEAATDKSAVVMFHIPDIGIRFKAPFAAVDQDHSDLASMLALLEFIDSNQKYFDDSALQLYGNNLSIINQVNGLSAIRPEFLHLLEKAATYRKKYRFSLDWIPVRENSIFGDDAH
ncbi:hypothetical protein GF377_09495 [candidate division GN15 bacterium]|nr:hypothetical protein [candidate division GN15 bacterium]